MEEVSGTVYISAPCEINAEFPYEFYTASPGAGNPEPGVPASSQLHSSYSVLA